MQHAELQADSYAYFHVIMQCFDQSLVFCQTDCVFQMLSVDLRPHTLCPLLMLHESTGPMRKSVSQTLFRPLKNVRLPPSQCHKSFSTSSIPKVNIMFYGVLERTRGMLSNLSALQKSLENMKLYDITPSHTNANVYIVYQLFLTFTSKPRWESAGVFCGDFGNHAEWIYTQLKCLSRARNTTFILKQKYINNTINQILKVNMNWCLQPLI